MDNESIGQNQMDVIRKKKVPPKISNFKCSLGGIGGLGLGLGLGSGLGLGFGLGLGVSLVLCKG
jgi:hypothetical protein